MYGLARSYISVLHDVDRYEAVKYLLALVPVNDLPDYVPTGCGRQTVHQENKGCLHVHLLLRQPLTAVVQRVLDFDVQEPIVQFEYEAAQS